MNEDNLTHSLCALTTVDDTVDSVHLTTDTGSSSEEAVCNARIARRRKLNAIVKECNVMPLNQNPCFHGKRLVKEQESVMSHTNPRL